MAKYKVGDRVKVKGAGMETIKAVYPKGRGAGVSLDASVDWYASSEGGLISDEDIERRADYARARNTLRPYGSWRVASRGNLHVGDYVVHKADYARFKGDEERLDRNSERVAGVRADGFWTSLSGTNELERYEDYYVFNSVRSRNAVVRNALNAAKSADSPFYKAYAGKAIATIHEIQYEAEGRLRVLSGLADELSAKARAAGDAKGWNDINRCQGLLKDALASYVRTSTRTVG